LKRRPSRSRRSLRERKALGLRGGTTPTSGRGGGAVQRTQRGTNTTNPAECVSSRALVGVQESAVRFSGVVCRCGVCVCAPDHARLVPVCCERGVWLKSSTGVVPAARGAVEQPDKARAGAQHSVPLRRQQAPSALERLQPCRGRAAGVAAGPASQHPAARASAQRCAMAQMDSYCRKAPSSGGRQRGCCAECSERPRGGGKACCAEYSEL